VDILRFSTAGSVDDGKSTFIGRLLYDTGNIYTDHLAKIKKGDKLSLAVLTDGLQAEQEQGITIDVAYRYFQTKKRRFILADSPGHERYTRNMATAASTADATVVLIDAEKGITTQTKRHTCIASLLAVPRLIVAINKMDLVNFSEEKFVEIKENFKAFASKLSFKDVVVIPISALQGDNVVNLSDKMPWYQGKTVLGYLEEINLIADKNSVDARFPVQIVLAEGTSRFFGGNVVSGGFAVGDEITILPSLENSKIKSIIKTNGERLERASVGSLVNITLEDERDISRGDMIVRSHNRPHIVSECEAMLIWFDEKPLSLNKEYYLFHTTKQTRGIVRELSYLLDITSLNRREVETLRLNDIGRVTLELARPIFVDPYDRNRATGSFILVDVETNQTAAAGLIIERFSEKDRKEEIIRKQGHVSSNITVSEGEVTRAAREERLGYVAKTLWLTGLSGSGKSTISVELERDLFNAGRQVYRLDGDNLRHGLNRDLGFSDSDRSENIRRTAEVAKLLNEAGVTVICSLISPFEKDRKLARDIIGSDSFVEIYVATPLEVCEERDPKGLYKKARAGEITGFTGISAPYEEPRNPDIRIDTSKEVLTESVSKIKKYI
jgi:bifunctional enzyme CysN/CysC